MKKNFKLTLFICILITLLVLILILKPNNDKALEKIGYTNQQIELIKQKSPNSISFLEKNYISNIEDFIKDKDYQQQNITRYHSFYVNNTNIAVNKVIYLINNNYDNIDNFVYNEFIFKLINEEDYKLEKVNQYINYHNNNDNLSGKEVIFIVNNNYHEIKDFVYSTILPDLIKEQYYIKNDVNKYINYYNNNNDLSVKEVISHVNANINYPYYTNIKSSDLTKGNLVLVNKYNQLPSTYVPNLVDVSSIYGGGKLTQETYDAFIKLHNEAAKIGYNINTDSTYRSYTYQNTLYNNYVKRDSKEEADTYSARAGHSEHQTGLAIDVQAGNSGFLNFEYSKEFTWMKNNAHKYGFILRYKKGSEHLTGYVYESWHYRYVGVAVATKVYNEGITYDEYYHYYIENK